MTTYCLKEQDSFLKAQHRESYYDLLSDNASAFSTRAYQHLNCNWMDERWDIKSVMFQKLQNQNHSMIAIFFQKNPKQFVIDISLNVTNDQIPPSLPQ